MRKGGFNMYLMKEEPNTPLYENYTPKFPKHQDVELQAHIAYTVGNDMTKKMKSVVDCMTTMIIQDFLKRRD